MGGLINELRECNSRLRLEIEYECIKGADYGFGKNYEMSVVFIHDKGEIEYGSDFPTRREFWVEYLIGHDIESWAKLTYEEKKQELDEYLVPESPWVESNQEIDESTDTKERLNQWLDEVMEYDDHESVIDCMADMGNVSEYLPGLEIFNCLSSAEQAEIGMTMGDIGGPTSGEMLAVGVHDVDKLEELLVKYSLPFYFKSQVKS